MKLFEKIYNGFLNFFGDLKVFRYPMFIIYDPGSYLVKGEDIRQVINFVQPGDIFVRGYINYLDGYFIPGFFSHAGLYLGKVTEEDRTFVRPGHDSGFRTGDQMVIHSMAEGVFMEDVINFCRCDYMIILRRNPEKESEASKDIIFADVFKAALSNLGKAYDFKFDFADLTCVSCTELVYVCCQEFMEEYDIKVRERKVLFMKKNMIIPDDLVNSKLDLVWKSKSVNDERVQKIKTRKYDSTAI
jgi:hypothetical protein